MPKMNALRTYQASLFVNGAGKYGELLVTGFATARTANEIGKVMADAIVSYYGADNVEVDVQVKLDRTLLGEEGA